MDEDGTMARGPQSVLRQHALKLVTISDLIKHRMRNERLVGRSSRPISPPASAFPHPCLRGSIDGQHTSRS